MAQNRNFRGLIWHAFWLALARTFAEKNVVLPSLILFAGGTQVQVGILTSILIGVPLVTQIFFASYLTNKTFKKKFLLLGIYLRVFAFLGVGVSIFFFKLFSPEVFIAIIFLWMALFALSGAFAGISYMDIIGKSFNTDQRKQFFVTRQFLSGGGIFISALIVDRILSQMQYPGNYQAAFLTAAALLFIASIGFLYLREKPSGILRRYQGAREVFKSIPGEIKQNSNLKYFIVIANLLGFTFVLVPFYLGFIQHNYSITPAVIGRFLLVQIAGMVLSNFVWRRVVRTFSFKGMLKITVVLLSALPLLALLLNSWHILTLYYSLFFLAGSAISAQKIALDGVIIEITNETNRPLYTGIFGTFNLTSAVIPVLLGFAFVQVGYPVIFVSLALLTLSAFPVIKKMECPVDLERV